MACNHTYRDYTKMTVEEMVSYIAQDGKISEHLLRGQLS